MTAPLARAGVLVPFARFLDEAGVPSWKVLEAARLPPEPQTRPADFVPLVAVLRFGQIAARAAGVEDIGAVVGLRTPVAALGELGAAVRAAPTLRGALRTLSAAVALYNSGEIVWVQRKNARALLCHDFRSADLPARTHGDTFTLGQFVDVIRLAAGPRWTPRAVYVRPEDLQAGRRYEQLYEAPVVSGAGVWAVEFDAKLLDAPLRGAPGLGAAVGPLQSLAATAPPTTFAGSVGQVVASLLRGGNVDVACVAEYAGFSVRTLQRHLGDEGRSYSQIVDEVRFDLARRLLRRPDLKLIDVALESGYQDPANFTRAFRRWAGVSPTDYRRKAGGAR